MICRDGGHKKHAAEGICSHHISIATLVGRTSRRRPIARPDFDQDRRPEHFYIPLWACRSVPRGPWRRGVRWANWARFLGDPWRGRYVGSPGGCCARGGPAVCPGRLRPGATSRLQGVIPLGPRVLVFRDPLPYAVGTGQRKDGSRNQPLPPKSLPRPVAPRAISPQAGKKRPH
jgi:hypothetical protein